MAQGRSTPDLRGPGTAERPTAPGPPSHYLGGLSLVQSAMVQRRPSVREPRQADAGNPSGAASEQRSQSRLGRSPRVPPFALWKFHRTLPGFR